MANQKFTFGSGSPDNGALQNGWAQPEQGQVWSDGGTATLLLKIRPLGGTRLSIYASPKLVNGSDHQTLGVYGNGLLIGWCRLDRTGHVELRIPQSVSRTLITHGHLELSFALPDYAPGSGADQRRLGIALHSIEIDG